jgi:hypothetical protein
MPFPSFFSMNLNRAGIYDFSRNGVVVRKSRDLLIAFIGLHRDLRIAGQARIRFIAHEYWSGGNLAVSSLEIQAAQLTAVFS